MKNFLSGLGLGLVGLAIWAVASIIAATAGRFGKPPTGCGHSLTEEVMRCLKG